MVLLHVVHLYTPDSGHFSPVRGMLSLLFYTDAAKVLTTGERKVNKHKAGSFANRGTEV
jgi:hypothetical protein